MSAGKVNCEVKMDDKNSLIPRDCFGISSGRVL